MDNRLLQRGLLQAGLVPLNTPQLIQRYNTALDALGIEPTHGESIHIDGIGWSPEVARERQNNFYLSHGTVNPLAVIVSPEQYKRPVYFPLFSWERGMMRLFFETYHREIADITATHSISIGFEDGLSVLGGPTDLLLLSEIRAVPDTGGLAEAGQGQRACIERFLDGVNCLYPQTRDDLYKSLCTFGDLQKRKVSVAPLSYDLFKDFYTVAFEGAAVLRAVGTSDMLVLAKQATYESVKDLNLADARISWVGDPNFLPFKQLAENGWIDVPLAKYRADARLLEEKKDTLLAWHLLDDRRLCETEPLLQGKAWSQLTRAQRNRILEKYGHAVPEMYFELERFTARLRGGGRLPNLSAELQHFLSAPAEWLHPSTMDVLWILLTRRDPRNILELYTVDKNHFLADHYNHWCEAKKEWAAWYLERHYVRRMDQ